MAIPILIRTDEIWVRMEYHAHTMPAAPIGNRIDAVGHVISWTMDLRGCDSGNHDTSYLSDECLKYAPGPTTADFYFSNQGA